MRDLLVDLCPAGAFWFGNSCVAVRVSACDGLDAISIVEHWVPFGDGAPRHIRWTEDCAFHLLEGRLRFLLDGEMREISAGEILLVPRGRQQGHEVVSPGGARFLTIARGGDFESFLRRSGRPAAAPGLPEARALDADAFEALAALAAAHRIDILGPVAP